MENKIMFVLFVIVLAIACGTTAFFAKSNRNVEPAQTVQEVQVVKAEVKSEIPVSVTKCTKVNQTYKFCQEYTTYRITE